MNLHGFWDKQRYTIYIKYSLPVVIHITPDPTINGEISATDVSLSIKKKTTTFSSFPEFSSSGLKVSSAFAGSRDVPGACVLSFRLKQ